jgi:hypothetical protein
VRRAKSSRSVKGCSIRAATIARAACSLKRSPLQAPGRPHESLAATAPSRATRARPCTPNFQTKITEELDAGHSHPTPAPAADARPDTATTWRTSPPARGSSNNAPPKSRSYFPAAPWGVGACDSGTVSSSDQPTMYP